MIKKTSRTGLNQKSIQRTVFKKQHSKIIFQYNNLSCFISSSTQKNNKPSNKSNKTQQKIKNNVADLLVASNNNDKNHSLSQLRVPRANRGFLPSLNKTHFNNSVLLLEFQKQEEPKAQLKQNSRQKQGQRQSPKNEEQSQEVNEILKSCMRIVTQDTQHSSNPISARYTPSHSSHHEHLHTMPVNFQMPLLQSHQTEMMPSEGMIMTQQQYYYNQMLMIKNPAARNRRTVSQEQSREYVIDIRKIQLDGRTTIMIRNIPNKYTQDMLLQLFQKNHKKKFDFFYLPIDYNNNCNVGYAFLNFISTKFIADFYQEFNNHKWNRFNSIKVCQVCYARIQGTAQLQHHFQQTNVLQQKDRRFRPLIGLKSLHDNISTLVYKQQNEQNDQKK